MIERCAGAKTVMESFAIAGLAVLTVAALWASAADGAPALPDWDSEIHKLQAAIAEEDIKEMNTLLDHSPELVNANASLGPAPQETAPTLRRCTMVGFAARLGRKRAVEVLLDRGAKHTVFSAAAVGDESALVSILTEDPAAARATYIGDETPLHVAAIWGHVRAMEILLQEGAKIDAKRKSGATPLHLAVWWGREGAVRLLVENGADVNAESRHGVTPLHVAASARTQVAHARTLLTASASADLPAVDASTAIAKLLLEAGADVNASTDWGASPLRDAIHDGFTDMVELLLSRGAEHDIFTAAASGEEAAVERFLEAGPSLLQARAKLGTPLHWAARGGATGCMELLLARGASVTSATKSGETPLHWAARRGQERAVEVLLQRGAAVNRADSYGDTALHLAAKRGHVAVVELLLANGADVDAKNEAGWTALHRAASEGQRGVAETLLANGADVYSTATHGRTPLHIAIRFGHEDMARLLRQHGTGD